MYNINVNSSYIPQSLDYDLPTIIFTNSTKNNKALTEAV